MNETTTEDNSTEVVADAFILCVDLYLKLLENGKHESAYQELGKTIRCMVKALEPSFNDSDFDDDDPDPGEEQDEIVNGQKKCTSFGHQK